MTRNTEQKIVLVGGGDSYPDIRKIIKDGDVLFGVDRGAIILLSHELPIHLAIGDFDSVTKQELEKIKTKALRVVAEPPHPKDITDMEMAVREAIAQNPSEIVILGAIGSRMDHTLANIGLLDMCEDAGISAEIIDENNRIRLLSGGRTIFEREEGYPYVSIVAYTQKILISLQGLRYPLDRQIITHGQTLGISNEFVSEQAEIVIHEGKALVILSKDS